MKKGTPRKDVMIPQGNSAGRIITRASVSEISSSEAPIIEDEIMRLRVLGKNILRAIWGAIKPANEIVPPRVTAQETARLPESRTRIRISVIFTPR